jgi:hypothetical protein
MKYDYSIAVNQQSIHHGCSTDHQQIADVRESLWASLSILCFDCMALKSTRLEECWPFHFTEHSKWRIHARSQTLSLPICMQGASGSTPGLVHRFLDIDLDRKWFDE